MVSCVVNVLLAMMNRVVSGVQLLQDLRYVGAVDVGDKVDLGPDGERLESLRDHERPEVGASNADVDNVRDALAGETFPLAADDSPTEVLHVVQHSVDTGHHVLTADHDGSIRPVPESYMQDCPVFCEVNLLSGKHSVSRLLD